MDFERGKNTVRLFQFAVKVLFKCWWKTGTRYTFGACQVQIFQHLTPDAGFDFGFNVEFIAVEFAELCFNYLRGEVNGGFCLIMQPATCGAWL